MENSEPILDNQGYTIIEELTSYDKANQSPLHTIVSCFPLNFTIGVNEPRFPLIVKILECKKASGQ